MPPQEDALQQWLNSSHKRRFRRMWEELRGYAARINRFAVYSADIIIGDTGAKDKDSPYSSIRMVAICSPVTPFFAP